MSATVDDALFAILNADADVLALVGPSPCRAYANLAPENPTFPLVVYRHFGGSGVASMQGQSGLRRVSIDFECWADKPSKALEIAQAVLMAFDEWNGYQAEVAAGNVKLNSVLFAGEAQDYDDTHGVHAMTYSFDVMYNEAV
ncbi:MAG: DUF3168 domain-containing protein [Salinibacterium sp.]|nr:MAG: DUF3168 domain-containing protein [Salinibacterium sp.]